MSIIDTHCHYNLEPIYSQWQQHWSAAQKQGVTQTIVVGADPESNARAIEISTADPQLHAALGLHPGYYDALIDAGTTLDTTSDLRVLAELAKTAHPIAIGETGLDYFHFSPTETEKNDLKIKAQKEVFIAQIKLANELNLPLIIHVRDTVDAAYLETLNLIKTHYQFQKPFILHCASGPLSYIEEAIALGAYVGFDGNITYKKNQPLLDIFTMTPPERRLLETDAPFLPPVPYRGRPCDPWMISKTAEYVATQLQADLTQIEHNTQTCFGLSL
jgi:TatD DNase family protein